MRFIGLVVLFFSFVSLANPETIPNCAHYVSKDRTQAQVLHELYGGSLEDPAPRSRLSRYLKKTHAAYGMKRFAKNRDGDRGPAKLVVAVSPKTFPVFKELFGSTYANGLEHLHTPGQGTLLVRWMTQTFQYARPSGEWRFPEVGSLGPMIILSDSEAERLRDYWVLNRYGQKHHRQPWLIQGYGYPTDAYGGNCTAWFGHIPLGDQTESKITAPGSIDRWGDGGGRAPRHGVLQKYGDPFPVLGNGIDVALLKKVWSAPLSARLFTLLKVPFELANHTNPGWVALTLTALTRRDRVPFVIYYTDDHTRLPAHLESQINLVGG